MPPYARACALATRVLTRAVRVRARLREYHTLCLLSRAGKAHVLRGYNKRFNGPVARFSVWPMHWPRRAVLWALLACFRALLGLCVWLAMLGKLGAGLRCLFCLYIRTVLDGYTVHRCMA